MLTRRQVITESRDRLIAQGSYARSEKGGYTYKSKDGNRCAIGILPGFPKELENSASFAYTLFNDESNGDFRALFAPGVDGNFLSQVQSMLHDHLAYDDSGEPLPFDAERVRKAAAFLLRQEDDREAEGAWFDEEKSDEPSDT